MSTLGLVINCRTCGKEFKKTRENSKFCSRVCNNKNPGKKVYGDAWGKDVEASCKHCGTLYVARFSANMKYCSDSCSKKAYRLRKNGPPVEAECLLPSCSEKFIRKNKNNKFCSTEHQRSHIEKSEDRHRYYAIEGLACSFYKCDKPATTAAGEDWTLCYRHYHNGAVRHNLNPKIYTLMSFSGCSNSGCIYEISEKNRLVVDHDHACCASSRETGRGSCGKCVRGLLCETCNKALTSARTLEYFEGLLSYLNKGEENRRIREGRLI